MRSTSLTVTGSGGPGDPWVIEGASPSVMTNAARLALSGAGLYEPRYVWTTDTNTLWVYNGSAWEIASEPPQTWTLAAFAQGATTIPCTTDFGWYKRDRGIFTAQIYVIATGPGSALSNITIATPVTLLTVRQIQGTYNFYDQSIVTAYAGIVVEATTGSVVLQSGPPSLGGLGSVGFTAAVASGDELRLTMIGRYA